MDFLDPKKRKKHTRRLYLGYILVAIAIGLGALILLFAAYGYGVDTKGNVFQNGLVFLASTPDEAEVKVRSKDGLYNQTVITSDRLDLKAQEYSFEFLKQGYRPWKRTVDVRGGGIERLVYPLLVPEQLNTANDEQYSAAVGLATQSPDRQTILVQQPGSLGTFDVFDAEDTTKSPQSFTIPSSVFPANAQAKPLTLVEWSTNNRHLLVRYDHASGPVFIMIDRAAPAQSFNINARFSVSPVQVTLRDKDPGKFYVLLKNKQLASLSLDAPTPDPIATNVAAYKSHGDDTLLFVTTNGRSAAENVVAYMRQNSESYKLRELPKGTGYVLDLTQFNNQWYVVAGSKAADEAYVYRDPIEIYRRNDDTSVPTIRTLRVSSPQSASFSANSRFVAVQSGQNFAVYDAEKDRQYRYEISNKFDKPGSVQWMDGHRLLGTTGSNAIMFDFDGINRQILSHAQPGRSVMFSPNYDRLYTLVKSPDGSALTRTSLRVP